MVKFHHAIKLFILDICIFIYYRFMSMVVSANHSSWNDPLSTDGSVFYIFILVLLLIGLNVLVLLRLANKDGPPIKEVEDPDGNVLVLLRLTKKDGPPIKEVEDQDGDDEKNKEILP